MEESLHPHPIITPVGLTVNKLGWQSAFDYCRCRPPGIQCLITPASQVDIRLITPAVWFFPVIAGSHEDLFFCFLAEVCHGALSVCKHLCLEVCRRGAVLVWGVIIDSSEARPGVISFAWQASV